MVSRRSHSWWLAALGWLVGAAGLAATPTNGELILQHGLATARFTSPDGLLLVHLPSDLAAGDTVSGSFEVVPAGDTERRRSKARSRLGRLGLSVGGQVHALTGSRLRGTVCGDLACRQDGGDTHVPIAVTDPKGRIVAEILLPVDIASPPPSSYVYAPVAIAGEPFEIRGSFDGEVASTRVRVGGLSTTPLAESPRRTVVVLPAGAMGATSLELVERGQGHRGSLRSLAVSLAAGKPVLHAGERTTLRLEIHGLGHLEDEMPLQIVALDPRTTRLEQGAVHTLRIHPSEVQAGGAYLWIGTAVGVSPGPVEVMLSTRHARPEQVLTPDG